jgi:hypothetical protein
VSKSQTIARLEALLVRVQSRAAAPRTAPALAATMAPAAAAAPPTVPPPAEVDEETTPLAFRARAEQPTEAEVVVDVDVQEVTSETVIGVPAEEVVVAEAFESRERLVAAEPVAPEPVALEPLADVVEPSVIAEPPDESPPELLAAVEEVEEAPLSSRRPVAPQPEERLADMAFGAEEPSPPRHTPPPESGRLPAAPTLEFDGDVTGVRDATPIAVAAPIAVAEPTRLREFVPESTRGSVRPSDAVADIVGAAQRFAPTTFGALLDASLAL